MKTFTATQLANSTGEVFMAAASSIVSILRNGKPQFVILSQERYDRLVNSADTRRSIHIDDMTDSEADSLVAELEASIQND